MKIQELFPRIPEIQDKVTDNEQINPKVRSHGMGPAVSHPLTHLQSFHVSHPLGPIPLDPLTSVDLSDTH